MEGKSKEYFDVHQAELSGLGTFSPRDIHKDYQEYAIARQLNRCRKRFRQPSNFEKQEKDAITLFEYNNGRVLHDVSLPADIIHNGRTFIARALENYTSGLDNSNIQRSLDSGILLSLWRFGPGASIDAPGTHAVDKMYANWSVTRPALDLTMLLRRNHPYLRVFDSLEKSDHVSLVVGSRLTTVPKNEDVNRTIAVEPLGNMALQLAAGSYLEGALRYLGVDIRSQQPLNRELARRGSIDGSLATIDLSSASDLISPELVRLLMPREWYELLMKIRSPCTTLPDGRVLDLRMISTMGNGFTFPLMTLLLLALYYGVTYKAQRPWNIDYRDFAVFGDDLIVKSTIYDQFCSTIERAGFIVNHDKSFCTGQFRESCGGDYYRGYDVTPFYVKSLDTDAEIYVAINQLLKWSAKVEVPLPKSLSFLFGMLRNGPYFVPEWEDPFAGVCSSWVPKRRYKALAIQQDYRRVLLWDLEAMPLVVGGYITSRGDRLMYLPRPFKTRYKAVTKRLPKGYLDGSGFWPEPISRFIRYEVLPHVYS